MKRKNLENIMDKKLDDLMDNIQIMPADKENLFKYYSMRKEFSDYRDNFSVLALGRYFCKSMDKIDKFCQKNKIDYGEFFVKAYLLP